MESGSREKLRSKTSKPKVNSFSLNDASAAQSDSPRHFNLSGVHELIESKQSNESVISDTYSRGKKVSMKVQPSGDSQPLSPKDAGDVEMSQDIAAAAIRQSDIDMYINMSQKYYEMLDYESALFWADKVVTLSEGTISSYHTLFKIMCSMKQYRRALVRIRKLGLEKLDLKCRFLAIKCLVELDEISEARSLLLGEDMFFDSFNPTEEDELPARERAIATFMDLTDDDNKELRCQYWIMMGNVYEKLTNPENAMDSYKNALKCDINCYEAVRIIIDHNLMTRTNLRTFVRELISKGESRCDPMTLNIYNILLNVNSDPGQYLEPERSGGNDDARKVVLYNRMRSNFDVMTVEAEVLYYRCCYQQAYEYTKKIMQSDPFHARCLPIHIAVLVVLSKHNELFLLAHNLMDLDPEVAISWYAVGCYYYAVGKQVAARRYLGKALSIEKTFGIGWLTYGHSFGIENEHDHAMNSYFKAAQLMCGCYLPFLYVGLENALTNNFAISYKFYQQARALAPQDPFVLHEIGVVAYKNNNWKKAEEFFLEGMRRVKELSLSDIPSTWEILYINLGHVNRKLKDYEKASHYFRQALRLRPNTASTYSALGHCETLLGEFSSAVRHFHTSLTLRRNDNATTTMLNTAVEMESLTLPAADVKRELGKDSKLIKCVRFRASFLKDTYVRDVFNAKTSDFTSFLEEVAKKEMKQLKKNREHVYRNAEFSQSWEDTLKSEKSKSKKESIGKDKLVCESESTSKGSSNIDKSDSDSDSDSEMDISNESP